MNAITLYRVFLLVPIFTGIAVTILHYAAPGYVSEDWRALLQWDGNGGLFDQLPSERPSRLTERIVVVVSVVASAGFVLFALAVQIGMLFYWRFARPASLAVTMIVVALTPFLGVSVTLPLENMLYDVGALCDGAALAMAYSSPISERFNKVQSPA